VAASEWPPTRATVRRCRAYEDAGSVCAARSSQGAWRTSGRSVAVPSADHACHLPPAADDGQVTGCVHSFGHPQGLRSGARGLPGPHPTLGRPQRPTRPVPTAGHRQLGAVEMYIGPFDPARLASAKAAVPDDGRAPGGASPGLPHPGGRGRI